MYCEKNCKLSTGIALDPSWSLRELKIAHGIMTKEDLYMLNKFFGFFQSLLELTTTQRFGR